MLSAYRRTEDLYSFAPKMNSLINHAQIKIEENIEKDAFTQVDDALKVSQNVS